MTALFHRLRSPRAIAFYLAVLAFTVGALAALLAPTGAISDTATQPSANSPGRELSERRTQSSRTYLQDDGALRTRFFAESVNFKDGSGDWRAIDNDLEPAADGHVNKANRYRLGLPDSLAKPVRVSEGGAWVEYGLVGATASAAVEGSKARYADAAKGVDLAYEAQADVVKETLTLDGPESERTFRFTIKASPGLTAHKRARGAIALVDPDGEVKFSFAPPIMWDSSKHKALSHEIAVDLSRAAEGYTVEVRPDRAWLDSKRRQWPVVVDPTLTFGAAQDCYILGAADDDPLGHFYGWYYCSTGSLLVGMNEEQDCSERMIIEYGDCYVAHPPHRTSLKFNLGSVIPKDALVKLAGLYLYSNGGGPISVDAHGVTQAWTTPPPWGNIEPTVAAGNPTAGGSVGWTQWYPTGLVSRWVSGETPNNGLLLKQSSEVGTTGANFDSTEATNTARKPYLEVQWQPPTGEQSFNTFEDQQLTDRSSVGVNVASGNLLVRNSDLEIKGTGLDLTVPRFYNSLSSSVGSLGQGWSMGTGEDVRLVDNADGSMLFYGPTGEVLRFAQNADGSYETPPGMKATLRRLTSTTHELSYNASGEKRTFTSSGPGTAYRLTAHADRYGNAIRLVYSQDKLSSITDTQGRVTTVTRNPAGRIAKLTDSTGRSVQYGYDAQNRLQTYTDGAAMTTTYGYDASSRLNSITSPAGRVTKVTYDAQGRVYQVIRTTDANHTSGPTTKFTYSVYSPCRADETRTIVSDPAATGTNGHKTTYCSGAPGTVPGTVRMVVDADSKPTDYTYDAKAKLTSVRRPGGGVTNMAYDPATQNLLCVQRGVTVVQNCQSASGGLKTSLEYANTDALTKYFPTKVTNPQGNSVAICYNGATPACGSQSGPAGSIQSTTNELISENTRRLSYNNKGNITTYTDARGKSTTYGYDASGDNLTSITPPAGAGLGNWTIQPDALSRPRVVTDGKGQTATYGYDGVDRVRGLTYAPGGPALDHAYDGDGNLRQLFDPTFMGSAVYRYDQLNRVEFDDLPEGTNSYTYDAASNLKTLTDSGGTTTYNYNGLNQLSSVTVPGDTASTTFAYNTDGARTLIKYPSGVTVNTGYHVPSGRVTSVSNKGPLGNVIKSFAYNYIKDFETGLETELAQSVTDQAKQTTTNTYDRLDRLTEAVTSGSKPSRFQYVLDGNGNRLSQTFNRTGSTGGNTETYAYDPASLPCWRAKGVVPSICAAPPQSDVKLYTHDANGNDLNNSHQSYSYNAANQATSVNVFAVGVTAPLAYRGAGQSEPIRDGSYTPQSNLLGIGVRAYTGSATGGTAAFSSETASPCNGGELSAFAGASTTAGATSYYARAVDGTLLSQRTPSSSQRRNYLYDGQGSVVGLTDGAGALKTGYTYEPYGHPANVLSLGDPNPFGYLGAYTAGVESDGVICGGPVGGGDGGGFYDPEDGRPTQRRGAPGNDYELYGLPSLGDVVNGAIDDVRRAIGDLSPELSGGVASTATLAAGCSKLLPSIYIGTAACAAAGLIHGSNLYRDIQDPDDDFYLFE